MLTLKKKTQSNFLHIRQKKIFIGDRGGGGGEERGSRLRAVEHDPLVSDILSPEDIQIRTINKFYSNH